MSNIHISEIVPFFFIMTNAVCNTVSTFKWIAILCGGCNCVNILYIYIVKMRSLLSTLFYIPPYKRSHIFSTAIIWFNFFSFIFFLFIYLVVYGCLQHSTWYPRIIFTLCIYKVSKTHLHVKQNDFHFVCCAMLSINFCFGWAHIDIHLYIWHADVNVAAKVLYHGKAKYIYIYCIWSEIFAVILFDYNACVCFMCISLVWLRFHLIFLFLDYFDL